MATVKINQAFFESKYKTRLNSSIDSPTSKWPISTGRPVKNFDESCHRSKRRKTVDLRKTADTQTMMYAAQIKYRLESITEISKI